MSLIDGIGNEVLHFLIAVFAITIITIAWRTTSTGDQWNAHTYYLLDRRILRRTRNQRRLTNHIEVATISESTMMPSDNPDSENRGNPTVPGLTNGDSILETSEEQEQSDIVEAMDGDRCTLRQRRVAYYANDICSTEIVGNTQLENNTHEENTSNNKDSDTAEISQHNTNTSSVPEEKECENSNSSNIRIKLKYINDDLKLVEGKLDENLGDFKKRHFDAEISSNKLVKLIFNGQILERDNETLQHCGFFDNCVVHCLIRPIRSTPTEETLERSNTNTHAAPGRPAGLTNSNNTSRDWDFGNILIVLLSFILGTAWYFRYLYPHLFTVTATVALVAVTGIFTVISVGMYFPDSDPVQVRQEVPS